MNIGAALVFTLLAVAGYSQNAVSGTPTYTKTGDAAADDARYAQEKKAWIAAHPAEYKEINANAEAPAKENLAPVGQVVAPNVITFEGDPSKKLPPQPRPSTPAGATQPSTVPSPTPQK